MATKSGPSDERNAKPRYNRAHSLHPAGSAYPHLTAMSTDDLTTMLRCVSEYPENADFAKAIVEEIKYRKSLTSMHNR